MRVCNFNQLPQHFSRIDTWWDLTVIARGRCLAANSGDSFRWHDGIALIGVGADRVLMLTVDEGGQGQILRGVKLLLLLIVGVILVKLKRGIVAWSI